MPNNVLFSEVLFFALSIIFHLAHQKVYFLSEMLVLEKEEDREKARNKRMCWCTPKKRQRERENTKLLLLLTLRRPVSCTHTPSHLSLLLSLFQPHLFTLTGLDRGLASPAVSSLFFSSLACPVLFSSLLCKKKAQKK